MAQDFEILNAIQLARQRMARCVARCDLALFSDVDARSNVVGFNPLILQTIAALRRLYELRHEGDDVARCCERRGDVPLSQCVDQTTTP